MPNTPLKPLAERQRTGELSVTSTDPTAFGCCNLFDLCHDGIFSLYYRGQLGLLDLFNWQISEDCYRTIEFISYLRAERSGQSATSGAISDPCADPYGFEWGECKLTVEDFGRLGRMGPVRDFMKPKYYCKSSPRVTLDGVPVESEQEWDMLFAMDLLLQDFQRFVVTGNSTTAGEFGGLQEWVNCNYDCSALDSTVIDWNSSTMSSSSSATNSCTGEAIPDGSSIVDLLLDAFMNIKDRIKWSPLLSAQPLRRGDVIIVLPGAAARCLLDEVTCWSLCADSVTDNYESRQFRLSLNGGMFGFGEITLDGFNIPLLVHDWGNVVSSGVYDMYMLTMRAGSQRIWQGEMLDAARALREYKLDGHGYFTSDAGKVLYKTDVDNLCEEIKVWMFPRLFCTAPWAQVRIQNVACTRTLRVYQPDPEQTPYPQSPLSPAVC